MEAGGSSESAAPSNSDQSNSSTKQNMAYRPQTNNRNGRNREPLIGSPPVRMPHQQPLIPGTPHISGHDDRFHSMMPNRQLRGSYRSRGFSRGGGGGGFQNSYIDNGHYMPHNSNKNFHMRNNVGSGGRGLQNGPEEFWRDNFNSGGPHNYNQRPPDARQLYDPTQLKALEYEGVFLRNYMSRKKKLKFKDSAFFCRVCEYHCDDVDHSYRHIRGDRHKKLQSVSRFENFLKSLPKPNKTMFSAITQTLEKVFEEQSLSADEREGRLLALQALQQQLKAVIPDSAVQMTGSTYSGLALKSSDVNVCFSVPEGQTLRTVLFSLKEIVEQCPDYSDVVCDFRYAPPTISYTATRHRCRVVLSPTQLPTQEMGRLLAFFVRFDKRFQILATAFIHWAKLCGVCDQKSGSLPSVAYAFMVAHFLQRTKVPVLPTLRLVMDSTNTKTFPPPEDIKVKLSNQNKQPIGELWHEMVHYYAHSFRFSSYNVTVTHSVETERYDKTYSKKMSIIDPFNAKKNLTRTVSNVAVFEHIIDWLLKTLCRYFSVPQLSFGPLFMALIDGTNGIICEKMSLLNTESDQKKEAKKEQPALASALEKAIGRLVAQKEAGKELSEIASETFGFKSAEQIRQPIDAVTVKESHRLIDLLHQNQFCFQFSAEVFTEGKSVPIFCTSCQQEGHLRDKCMEDVLPPLKDISNVPKELTDSLTTHLQRMRAQMAPTEEEVRCRNEVLRCLAHIIKADPRYKNAHLELFGSSANGFGFANSDLDVCVKFDGCVDENIHVQDLCNILRRNKNEFSDVTSIPTAKVPIVKFTSVEWGIEGDLSPNNTLALHNTRLLKTYANIDDRVVVLGYSFKFFAKKCDIGDASRGSLSSYAYTLMLLHFLQQCSPPVLPVLQELYDKDNPPAPVEVEGWNTWFFSDLEKLPQVWPEFGKNTKTVGELWVEMFVYYTELFNYEDHVINIRKKEPLFRLEKGWHHHTIAIEDPFDLNHNLGGALSIKMNTFIMKAFINGRHVYGGHIPKPTNMDLAEFYFCPELLTNGEPPNDRGCRKCGKIGHLQRNCPQKNQNARKKHPNGHDEDTAQKAAQRRAAAGFAPTKKKDKEHLLGEAGMKNALECVDVAKIDVAYSRYVSILKSMMDSSSRNATLCEGYRVYTVEWFKSVVWGQDFQVLVPDVLLEDKEPLVVVKVAAGGIGQAERDYLAQFNRHSNYFNSYIVDISLLEMGEQPHDFRGDLNNVIAQRKSKMREKKEAKKEKKKLERQIKRAALNEKKNYDKKNPQGAGNNSAPKPVPEGGASPRGPVKDRLSDRRNEVQMRVNDGSVRTKESVAGDPIKPKPLKPRLSDLPVDPAEPNDKQRRKKRRPKKTDGGSWKDLTRSVQDKDGHLSVTISSPEKNSTARGKAFRNSRERDAIRPSQATSKVPVEEREVVDV